MTEQNVSPEDLKAFQEWREAPEPEAKPVKLVDLIGSFSWIYETIKRGDYTADQLEEECEEIFEAFIQELLTPNWKDLHDAITNIHEGLADMSAGDRG